MKKEYDKRASAFAARFNDCYCKMIMDAAHVMEEADMLPSGARSDFYELIDIPMAVKMEIFKAGDELKAEKDQDMEEELDDI